MAPTSSTETMKHITLHHFLKQQRLKPTVMWTWQAASATGRAASDEAAAAADDVDGAMGWTWPPRSYTCAFCRREFRSAQALGGHMNVHRRDRAKMRGQYGAAAQLGLGGAAAPSGAEAPAPTEYAVLYPVLNSNAAGTTRAVYMPSGDVLLSAPMALAAAAAARGHQCHGNVDENDKEIDLELRLGWR